MPRLSPADKFLSSQKTPVIKPGFFLSESLSCVRSRIAKAERLVQVCRMPLDSQQKAQPIMADGGIELMIAHTPTIFASVALVAITMVACLVIVGRFRREDGLFTIGCGLLAHACAYVCYTLYGHASLWISYALANTLLSTALAFYTASIFRIRTLPVPWLAIFSLPAIMALCMALLVETREPRMLLSSVVLMVQCGLIVLWAHRTAAPEGRAHHLLMIGGAVSLVGLLIRVLAILGGSVTDMRYDVSNLKQSISVSIGTVTVMTLSLGLILMAKERSESALRQLALRDGLTGLLNRRAILDRMIEEMERAKRSSTPLAVAMLDIDYFKQINDRFGHLAGDQVLGHCARHMGLRLRKIDGLGRYGGEEFLLLLPDTDPHGAMAVVEELRESIAESVVMFEGEPISVSFSAGVWCDVPALDDNADKLIGKADAALYQAKHQGRNRSRMLPCERVLPDNLSLPGYPWE